MTKRLFTQDERSVLERGLESMTKALESLTREREILIERVEDLEAEASHLRDRLIIDREERE